jgi:predicted RNA-binding Zn-ribbon protein involved in translation (DUF1610 family)
MIKAKKGPAHTTAKESKKDTYTVRVQCPNCGASYRKTYPRGMRVGGHCSECGVYGLRRMGRVT